MTEDETTFPITRRTALRSLGAAGLSALAADAASAADDTNGTRLDAEVTEVEKPTRIREYPTYDGEGNRAGSQTWRVVRGTGNCCENYLAGAPSGALYDAGGMYVFESPDDGRTWRRVAPSTPWPQTAEGAISAAPNGDVVAVDWNPYSGDRLVAFKYDADDSAWYYNEVPLKTPFYDREWLAVLPGPFTVDGTEWPYLVLMKGGYPSDDAVLYASVDGLNYTIATSRTVDSEASGSVETYLDDVPDASILDWTQPHTESYFTPLGDGRCLTDETAFSARAGFTEIGSDHCLMRDDSDGDVSWYGFDTPAGLPQGRFQTDSRGYLHAVQFETDSTFVYRYSTDGGKNWTEYRRDLPGNYEVREGMLWDFKVHGGNEMAALAVHATDPEAAVDQDMVFRFTDVRPGSDPSVEVLYLGKADVSYVVGVSTAERYDFATLAILPDGRVATSYADAESPDPRVAIEAPGETPEGPPLELAAARSDDGDAFTGGQTNEVRITATPDRDAVVRDVVPEEWDVLTDYSEDVDRVEHRDNAGVKYVYFRDAAPAGEGTDYTYLAEAPSNLDESNSYTFGPVQGRPADGEAWVSAAGSTDDNAVLASDTEV